MALEMIKPAPWEPAAAATRVIDTIKASMIALCPLLRLGAGFRRLALQQRHFLPTQRLSGRAMVVGYPTHGRFLKPYVMTVPDFFRRFAKG